MANDIFDANQFDSATIRIRNPDTGQMEDFEVGDLGPYPIWSAGVVATTQSAVLNVFNYSFGENVTGTSTAAVHFDTNLYGTKGQLETNEHMVVYAMRLLLPAAITLADIKDLLDKTTLKLYLGGQKPVFEVHAALVPAGGGIAGASTQNAAEAWTNGSPSAAAVRALARPFGIRGGRSIRGEYNFSAALSLAATRRIVLYADGMRARIVE